MREPGRWAACVLSGVIPILRCSPPPPTRGAGKATQPVVRGAAEKAVDGSSAPMRPISGFSDCAARSRMNDALAALLVASPGSGPPGSPNLSSRFSAAPLVRGSVSEQDECPEAAIQKTDEAERLQRAEASPRHQGDDQEERRQPQRSRQLTAAEGLVSLGLEDQLSRETFVRVERGKDRVHAPPVQAPKLALLGDVPRHLGPLLVCH